MFGRTRTRIWATYKLDGDLLVVEKVRALENHAKGTLPNLLSHPVVHPNNVR